MSVNPGDVITITVGSGGLGALSSGHGGDGENSEVSLSSNILTAYGGGGGRSFNTPAGTGGYGGTGSFTGAWTSTASRCGGYGATLTSPTAPSPGGGAGGGAGQSANGKNAGNTTSNCSNTGGGPAGGSPTGFGGAGGNGGVGNSNGDAGIARGGGGGGNAGTGFGGNGANGFVSIFYAVSLLPVELKTFTASPDGCNTKLAWSTASEAEFSHFEIERSLDGQSFAHLGNVLGANNPTGSSYLFTDETINASVYYRLKMMDIDGNFEYSKILEFTNDCSSKSIFLFPNPVQYGQVFSIKIAGYKSNENGVIKGELIAPTGMIAKVFELNEGYNQLSLAGLPPASYFLKVTGDAEDFKYQRLIILE
ncbi:MAG: hypothetical protein MUC59_16655 [Saprospiraceae bacterium]|nr:hypothetical protein [Saprospiraceae bacterium]